MISKFRLAAIPVIGAMILATGCSSPDALTGTRSMPLPHASKAPPPVKGKGPPDAPTPMVSRDVPLKKDITVTQSIDSTGGTISIPDAGLTVVFAPGALSRAVNISVTALKGPNVAYDFEPHGIVFNADVSVIQDMSATSLKIAYDSAKVIHGGYLPDGPADITPDNQANITDSFDAWTDFWVDDANVVHLKTSRFSIPHFSGYILSSGRR